MNVEGPELWKGVALALVLSAEQVVVVLWHAVKRRPTLARRPRARRTKRTAQAFGRAILSRYGPWIGLLWLGHALGWWTAASVGIAPRTPVALAFAAGACLYVLFYLAAASVSAFGNLQERHRRVLTITLAFIPAGRRARIFVPAAFIILNPGTEELIFRGLLVHQFALASGTLFFAISLGGIVNAINHAYQGRAAILEQVLFYAAAVTLLYSPLGLVGAIGFHFAGDAVPILRAGSSLSWYREQRRLARRRSAAERL